jgi:predicted HicB family RNase H-like nuclease
MRIDVEGELYDRLVEMAQAQGIMLVDFVTRLIKTELPA